MNYCDSPFSYHRRASREVMVGHVGIGGANPIRVQSMITCDTMDTEASIAQTMELAQVGCEIVRITAPTVKDAANLRAHRARLARARLRRADRRRHPFQTRSRDGSGEVGREGADQSRQLRRLEKVRDHRIHRRAIRRGAGADSRALHAAGEALPGARPARCASAPITARSATAS